MWCSRPLGRCWEAPKVGMLALRWSLPGVGDVGGALWVVILGDEYVMGFGWRLVGMGLGWRLVGMGLGWRLIGMYGLCMSFASGIWLEICLLCVDETVCWLRVLVKVEIVEDDDSTRVLSWCFWWIKCWVHEGI